MTITTKRFELTEINSHGIFTPFRVIADHDDKTVYYMSDEDNVVVNHLNPYEWERYTRTGYLTLLAENGDEWNKDDIATLMCNAYEAPTEDEEDKLWAIRLYLRKWGEEGDDISKALKIRTLWQTYQNGLCLLSEAITYVLLEV